MVHGFGPNLAVLGPKLDPNFLLQLGRRQAGAALYQCHFAVEIRLLLGMELSATPQTTAMRSSIVSKCPGIVGEPGFAARKNLLLGNESKVRYPFVARFLTKRSFRDDDANETQ